MIYSKHAFISVVIGLLEKWEQQRKQAFLSDDTINEYNGRERHNIVVLSSLND